MDNKDKNTSENMESVSGELRKIRELMEKKLALKTYKMRIKYTSKLEDSKINKTHMVSFWEKTLKDFDGRYKI